MEKTIEALDYLGQLINNFHSAFDENTRSLMGEPLKFFQIIYDEIKNLKQNGLISENMAKSYTDVLQDMYNNVSGYSDDTEERFFKLHEINNQQIEDCEKADKKLSEAFQVKWENEDKDTKEESKDIKDSKKELEHINDLMRFYETSYANSDALESVDGLAELVNGIKEAAENKFISESTAKTLIKPLQEIKKNIFDNEIHKEKMAEFSDVLQQKISNGEEEKSTFKSIVDGIGALRSEEKEEKTKDSPLEKREDQRTKSTKDVAQKQDDVDKALENQRQASKENSGKGNEEQEKAVRDQISKNEKEKNFLNNLEDVTGHILQLRNWAERANNVIASADMPMTFGWAREAFDSIDKLTFYVRSLEEHHTEEDLQQFKRLWDEELGSLSYIYGQLANLNAPLYDDDFKMKMMYLNGEVEDFLTKTDLLNQEEKSANISQINEQNQEQHNMQKTDVVQKQEKALDPRTASQDQARLEESLSQEKPKPINRFLEAQREANARRNQETVRPQPSPEQKDVLLNGKNGKPQEQKVEHTEPKSQPLSHSDLEEMGLARIEAFKEKYDLSMGGRKKYNKAQWEEILDQELGFTDIEDRFKEDFVKGMREFYWNDPEIRNGVRTNDIPKPSIKTQIDAQYRAREEAQHSMTAADAVKTQDEADKVLETQRQVSKENSGKGNEGQEKNIREQVSKNEEQKESIQQPKALDPRAAVQDQARVDEHIGQQRTQEQVNTPTQDNVFDIKDNSEEAGRKRIQAMKEKHGIKFRDGHEAGILIPKNIAEIMRSELGNSDIEKKYYEDIRKFVYDYTGIFNNGKGQDIGDFREKTSTVSENKHNAISEDQKQEAIEKIRNFIMTYDNLSSYDQGEANYELDKFSRYISSAAKEGLISGYEAAQYKDIIDNTYQKNDKRVSSEAVTKLWKLYKNQQSILSNSSQEQQPQSKALDPRTASQDQARVDDAFKPQEQNGQQDRKFGDRIRREDVPSFREGVKSITDKYRDQEQKKINREESQHTMTVADAAKTQDEADKVLETQRQLSKENSGKGNEEQEKTIREQVSKNEKQEKALDPRTASQDQARVDDAFKPQEEQKSQDKFSAFRAQLERKVPLEKDENTDNKKIDKPAAFKAGIENTKKLAENRQKAMMNYHMKKRKMEWDDH